MKTAAEIIAASLKLNPREIAKVYDYWMSIGVLLTNWTVNLRGRPLGGLSGAIAEYERIAKAEKQLAATEKRRMRDVSEIFDEEENQLMTRAQKEKKGKKAVVKTS